MATPMLDALISVWADHGLDALDSDNVCHGYDPADVLSESELAALYPDLMAMRPWHGPEPTEHEIEAHLQDVLERPDLWVARDSDGREVA